MKKNEGIIIGIFLLFSFIVLVPSTRAATSQYQRCTKGTDCTVGEFLYDDEYVPIATASCTLTSKDASGTAVLNSVAMTANTDGWYEYVVPTADKALGLYRSQICCTVAAEYLCLDKSFTVEAVVTTLSKTDVEGAVWDAQTSSHSGTGTFGKNLQNPTLTAADIWGYTNRTLTGYGNLISDIWNYSTRSISGFGTLASDIWSSTVRNLTGTSINNGEDLATKKDIETINDTTIQAINTINTNNNKNVTDTIVFGSTSGTLVFKPTVTNSSPLLSQTVPFTYYLPSEVQKDSILNIDNSLTINSSVSNPAISITGDVELKPLQSKTYAIEVRDVWRIPGSEIASIRKQTDELFKPLEKTSYFGQGSTIKSDITASLDKIVSGQMNANSPEEHIRTYREAVILLASAKDKLKDLKSLVASAGSIGTIFGFVGGIQTFATWGLVIVLIGGFVFLALYMKNLKNNETKEIEEKIHKQELISGWAFHKQLDFLNENQIKFLVFGFIIGVGILFGFVTVQSSMKTAEKKTEKTPPVAKKIKVVPTVLPAPTEIPVQKRIVIMEDALNVREKPGGQYKKVTVVKKGSEFNELGTEKDADGENWIHIQLADGGNGWILAKYTDYKDISSKQLLFSETIASPSGTPLSVIKKDQQVLGATSKKEVSILVPEGEKVNVRSSASFESKIVMTLSQEITTEQLDVVDGWTRIEFGWVPSLYVKEIKQ